ncbi:MAG: carbon monoxide dehydrogenase medium subunit [Hyphomicrobiales bacterium]|nr:carbon monoxide dehydrogenase medium subunit [Hyphomicrobiales bacterium]
MLAGGQSLVPIMAFRMARPPHLVDINEVEGLDRLAVEGNTLHIGARVRHAAFRPGALDGPTGDFLAKVMRRIAHHPIRTRGTFCGSLAHADPASEWCAVAAMLDAVLVARSVAGTREIPVREYFEAVMTTSLRPDEILVEARLPLLPAGTRTGFCEFSRRAGDFAIGMVLVAWRIENGRIVEPRFGIGGAEAFPRRLPEVEAFLNGAEPVQATWDAAATIAAAALDPLEDAVTSGDYRRDLVASLSRQAFEQACA